MVASRGFSRRRCSATMQPKLGCRLQQPGRYGLRRPRAVLPDPEERRQSEVKGRKASLTEDDV